MGFRACTREGLVSRNGRVMVEPISHFATQPRGGRGFRRGEWTILPAYNVVSEQLSEMLAI